VSGDQPLKKKLLHETKEAFAAFIPFFAFTEVSRVLSGDRLRELFPGSRAR
jgi:hypothetical protein